MIGTIRTVHVYDIVGFLSLHGGVILHVGVQPGALVVSHVFANGAMFDVRLVIAP